MNLTPKTARLSLAVPLAKDLPVIVLPSGGEFKVTTGGMVSMPGEAAAISILNRNPSSNPFNPGWNALCVTGKAQSKVKPTT